MKGGQQGRQHAQKELERRAKVLLKGEKKEQRRAGQEEVHGA